MFCRECGGEIADSAVFCLKCGVATGIEPPEADIGQDRTMRWLLPVGRSGYAVAAGYLGLFSLLVLPAPLALVFGIVAVQDIRRHPNKHGMGPRRLRHNNGDFWYHLGLGDCLVLVNVEDNASLHVLLTLRQRDLG